MRESENKGKRHLVTETLCKEAGIVGEFWPHRSWFIGLLETDDLRDSMRCSDVSKAKWILVFENKHTVPAHDSGFCLNALKVRNLCLTQ